MEYVKLLACHVDKLTSGSLLLRKKQNQKHSSLPLNFLKWIRRYVSCRRSWCWSRKRPRSIRKVSVATRNESKSWLTRSGSDDVITLWPCFPAVFYLKFSFITSNPTVCGGQKDAAADAGAHRETPDQSQELQETSRNGCKSRFTPSV